MEGMLINISGFESQFPAKDLFFSVYYLFVEPG